MSLESNPKTGNVEPNNQLYRVCPNSSLLEKIQLLRDCLICLHYLLYTGHNNIFVYPSIQRHPKSDFTQKLVNRHCCKGYSYYYGQKNCNDRRSAAIIN